MRVLCHLASFIGIKEDIVDVKRSSNKGLLVSSTDRLDSSGSSEGLDGPQALSNRSDIKVDLNFVVLYEPLIPPLSRYLSAYNANL